MLNPQKLVLSKLCRKSKMLMFRLVFRKSDGTRFSCGIKNGILVHIRAPIWKITKQLQQALGKPACFCSRPLMRWSSICGLEQPLLILNSGLFPTLRPKLWHSTRRISVMPAPIWVKPGPKWTSVSWLQHIQSPALKKKLFPFQNCHFVTPPPCFQFGHLFLIRANTWKWCF